ncbi:protein phosphatase inhibitor 2-like isoform X2 [Leucoraja erinacea]|uniref:protein phosphatase inhibitor 2-like isoform X2 n=1 Tax=Leucoraja erinaceus TaxID=7782 RepID=UPI00245536DB|nr:protein phosphatase inhibitor 2-like isoform X2 [Leucoraja erinacea]
MDKPVKSILKKVSSSDLVKGRRLSEDDSQKKSQSWDEMNIIATYKPVGKDYGHMTINEAKTPYRHNEDDEAGSSTGPGFNMEELRARMGALSTTTPHKGKKEKPSAKITDADDDDLTQADQEKKRQFEIRRRQIYDEGRNIKRARELIAREDQDDHEDSDSVHDEGYKYREQDDQQIYPEFLRDPSPHEERQHFLGSQDLHMLAPTQSHCLLD